MLFSPHGCSGDSCGPGCWEECCANTCFTPGFRGKVRRAASPAAADVAADDAHPQALVRAALLTHGRLGGSEDVAAHGARSVRPLRQARAVEAVVAYLRQRARPAQTTHKRAPVSLEPRNGPVRRLQLTMFVACLELVQDRERRSCKRYMCTKKILQMNLLDARFAKVTGEYSDSITAEQLE